MLERKHVHAASVVYIGKEANNIDEQALDVKKAQKFINEKAVYDFILNLTPERTRGLGIKQRIRDNGDLNLNTPAVRRLINI